jgi:hypothetical protein
MLKFVGFKRRVELGHCLRLAAMLLSAGCPVTLVTVWTAEPCNPQGKASCWLTLCFTLFLSMLRRSWRICSFRTQATDRSETYESRAVAQHVVHNSALTHI